MNDIIFCDVTLREGMQTPGVVFETADKIELAHMLDEAGIDQIQVALPGLDQDRLEETARICREHYRCLTEVMTDGTGENWREVIMAACACNSSIVHSFLDARGAAASEMAVEQAVTRLVDICSLIHGYGKLCNISFIGAFDANRNHLKILFREASKYADRIRIADSYGVALPEDMTQMVNDLVEAKQGRDVKLGIHCHNDIGLALANAVAGVSAGADLVDVSINGLGSRAGNVSLAEAGYVFIRGYKRRSSLQLNKMRSISKRTDALTKMPISVRAPLVGDRVFDEEVDIHAMEILEARPLRGIDPQELGAARHALYGKLTTSAMIRQTARNAGREIPEGAYAVILRALREFSFSHRGQVLDESRFWQIVGSILSA